MLIMAANKVRWYISQLVGGKFDALDCELIGMQFKMITLFSFPVRHSELCLLCLLLVPDLQVRCHHHDNDQKCCFP
jgi:hypothetical protein